MISSVDKLRIACIVYVRMGLSIIYDLRVRQDAFRYLYQINKERNPRVAEYCAQKCVEIMKRRGGKKLESMLNPEFNIG